MFFYFYEEAMQPVRKISVDGMAPNSFHLSPQRGNKTPEPFKADTATEIALKFIAHPQRASFFPYANIVTNTSFGTDGLLAAFTLLYPKQAEPMTGTLIAAAESGAFSSFSSEAGVKMDILLLELIKDPSPLSPFWKNNKSPKEALYYKTILPLLPDLLHNRDEYRTLWEKPFNQILHSMTLFETKRMGWEEYAEEKLSVIMDTLPPARQAMDTYCRGDLFLVIQDQAHEGGYRYTLSYRYDAGAETIRRPRIARLGMERLAEQLNLQETETSPKPMGTWQTNAPGMSPNGTLIFSNPSGRPVLSRIPPDRVVQAVLSHIRESKRSDRTEKNEAPMRTTNIETPMRRHTQNKQRVQGRYKPQTRQRHTNENR